MTDTTNAVTAVAAADPADAVAHFAAKTRFETDCWDVHEAMTTLHDPGFVLLDTRGVGGWETGHIAGAVHLPHREITADRLAQWPADTLFVTYCAGPHCNAADHGARRVAELGRQVKTMIGGVTGWLDEGFTLTT